MKRIYILLIINLFSTILSAEIISGIDLRDNKNINLTVDNTKINVYYFLSSTCPCSQASFDHLNNLQTKFKNFKFIGFHSNKFVSQEVAHDYFHKFKIDFPIIFDQKVKYADKFKAVKTPHVFVYGDGGKLLFQGGATNSRNPLKASKFYLQDALISLSKGEKPLVTDARTIGCYIQR